ncbi:GDCCVxC domain-containing (seleno)protein [Roseovarius sp. ZX-A-9]|uniref:GDCCVxC domain-containing (seleno)protein n=1 Tax=Roseovarius sp. ZX-A-9 TaxID=3014783 RepID=UPI00233081D1|nr:GDCCVxC domain-containing (seleno)protein [Roseovarius sp. ZX-A-9]
MAELTFILTCPECGSRRQSHMPADTCCWLNERKFCKSVLPPKQSDFFESCSYTTVPCPSVQGGMDCCG